MPPETWSIDVHERGLDARAYGLYRLRDVIGLDFEVQAVMLTQGGTADALLDAAEPIEAHGLLAFSFACHPGTHRSVACCVLLAAIVYPKGPIRFTTERMRRAAAHHGLM